MRDFLVEAVESHIAPRDVVFAGSLAEVLKFIKAELGKLEYKASEGK